MSKLKKLKELAENGVGGEKDNAMKLYETMKNKYGVEDIEDSKEIECEWFRYKNDIEKRLLEQICFMVTGDEDMYERTNKKYKLIGHYCTKFEKDEIEFYFEYYKAHFRKELDTFFGAFCALNKLYPDKSARCYKEHEDKEHCNRSLLDKMSWMAAGMQKCPRPYKQIEGSQY